VCAHRRGASLNARCSQTRITIWSLCNRTVAYIKFPKFASAGCDFSNDRRFMALAELCLYTRFGPGSDQVRTRFGPGAL
jgi:hypothetical protein